MTSSTYRIRATSRYATASMDGLYRQQPVVCPVPGCGKVVATTTSGNLCEHTNRYGFFCDGIGYPPALAARLQIDDAGRLVGVDEMAR